MYHSAPSLSPPEEGTAPDVVRVVVGVLLIAFAQIFTASQFVIEEFIMANHTIAPVQMVGWEGIFGFALTVVSMTVLYFVVGIRDSGRNGYFDVPYGAHQLFSSPVIWGTAIAIMFSIGYLQHLAYC